MSAVTHNERQCPTCHGDGEVTVNDTNPHGYGPDPQFDNDVECAACEGTGWIDTVPRDPILDLRAMRRSVRCIPSHYGVAYGSLLQRVVSPVALP